MFAGKGSSFLFSLVFFYSLPFFLFLFFLLLSCWDGWADEVSVYFPPPVSWHDVVVPVYPHESFYGSPAAKKSRLPVLTCMAFGFYSAGIELPSVATSTAPRIGRRLESPWVAGSRSHKPKTK